MAVEWAGKVVGKRVLIRVHFPACLGQSDADFPCTFHGRKKEERACVVWCALMC